MRCDTDLQIRRLELSYSGVQLDEIAVLFTPLLKYFNRLSER